MEGKRNLTKLLNLHFVGAIVWLIHTVSCLQAPYHLTTIDTGVRHTAECVDLI